MVTIGTRTTYATTTFRSQLEALWARELDRVGIAWRYEPRTFADGRIRYTPDFQLTHLPIFLEVKPANTRSINPGAVKLGERGVLPGPLIVVLGTPEHHRVIIASRLPHQELLGREGRWPRGERHPSLSAAVVAAQIELEATMPALAPNDAAPPAMTPKEDPHWFAALEAAMTEFQATGERARRAIRFLSGLLDKSAGLPLDAAVEAQEITARFLHYRHGDLSRPHQSVKQLVAEGWKGAVQCRIAYRELSQSGRDSAVARWGEFTDGEWSDNPLWIMCFPQQDLDALDVRAHGLGIGRGIPRKSA